MTRLIFTLAFLLGALAIVWTGKNFQDVSILGLLVVALIGAVYIIGLIELLLYRNASQSLIKANKVAQSGVVNDLPTWLESLHSSIKDSVRLRIEGDRVALPLPVLTPYLVGLLVMLGLLGTFVGMVDTLKGAVVALEGTTKLEAIRAGLTAPIGGLSLAFGTSVAGVAASAMLGLMSTLSRRERLLVSRQLDGLLPTVFKPYSREYQRQETYDAIQSQSRGIPEVTEKLLTLTEQMQQMNASLGQSLLANQASLNDTIRENYQALSTSVETAMKSCIADSGRLAAEAIKPAMSTALSEISNAVVSGNEASLNKLSGMMDAQLEGIRSAFESTTVKVSEAWQQGLAAHHQSEASLLENVEQTLSVFVRQNKESADSVLRSVEDSIARQLEQQSSTVQTQLSQWIDDLNTVQQQGAEHLSSLSGNIAEQWQQSASHSTNLLQQLTELINQSETLVQNRVESETKWLDAHQAQAEGIAASIKSELSALREEEENRGKAAVDRLSDLESSVAGHLANLGESLEAPMMRLIDMASETPKAAAEVIGKLRQEMSKNIERDNQLLEDRKQVMTELQSVTDSLKQSSDDQKLAVSQMLASSSTLLSEVNERFSEKVDSELEKVSEMATQVTGTAIELSSVGEAFQAAMQVYQDSNSKLVAQLNTIESSMAQATARSDEQLAYYVAQAREVIDHSVMTQKAVFDEIRQLTAPRTLNETLPAKPKAEVV